MKLTCIESLSIPAETKTINEDDHYFSDYVAFVLDGATGLGKPLIQDAESDAAWLVRKFKNLFRKHLQENHSLEKSLQQTILNIESSFNRLTRSSPIEKYRMPSAGLALISLEEQTLSIIRMGDCEVYCIFEDGQLWSPPQSPLEILDQHTINLLKMKLESGKNYLEARTEITPTLRKHRSMMNTPSGYSAVSPDHLCLKYIDHYNLEATNVKRVLLCSDGFSAAFKTYGLYNVKDILSKNGPSIKEVMKESRRVERNDEKLLRHPRLKPQDDATAILMEVNNLT